MTELFPESNNGHVPAQRGEGGLSTSGHRGQKVEELRFQDGSAARFFYCAKSSKSERNKGTTGGRNNHPTVKPLDLLGYLCRLITPPGGTILDPFMGSGSILVAAQIEGFNAIGIELDTNYCKIAEKRLVGGHQGKLA